MTKRSLQLVEAAKSAFAHGHVTVVDGQLRVTDPKLIERLFPTNAKNEAQRASHRISQILMQQAQKLIHEKWESTGGVTGPLGLATGEVEARETVGQDFQGGRVYLRPSSGSGMPGMSGEAVAEVQHRTKIEYAGIHCFGTTSEASSQDEIYVTIAIWAPEEGPFKGSVQVPGGNGTIDMEEGWSSATGAQLLWQGCPRNLLIQCTLMEHDDGKPTELITIVDGAMIAGITAAGTAVTAGSAAPAFAALAGFIVPKFTDWFAENVLGFGDDHVGDQHIVLDYDQQMSLPPVRKDLDLEFNFETPLISDGDASYKVYFRITREDFVEVK